jgi:hypothetical protein
MVVKDGLSSKDFVMNAKKFTYMKSLLVEHADMYTNIREPFNVENFQTVYTSSKTYSI